MDTGKVFLVGAGPGSSDLITVKGLNCIKSADVIIYDRLLNTKLLQYAKADCELIYVGKEPNNHTFTQSDINQLLVEKAQIYSQVVRLKGGDSSVFGRVGEEAAILAEHNIAFEIVPGITSGIAAPVYAGIPVTHRDYSSSVTFVTGHESADKVDSSIDWSALAMQKGTIVFYMGAANLYNIVNKLMRHGCDKSTPIALISNGTRTNQLTLTGTLETIVGLNEQKKLTNPMIIIVGEVVNLRKQLAWHEYKPLFGRRVLVTRATQQASQLSEMIENLGGETIELATIKIQPITETKQIEIALQKASDYDWLIFTSVNGVHCFFQYLKKFKIDIRNFVKAKIASIGIKTTNTLLDYGLTVDVMPDYYIASDLLKALEKVVRPGQQALIPRAMVANQLLPVELEKRGVIVTDLDVYKTCTLPTSKIETISNNTVINNTIINNTIDDILRQDTIEMLQQKEIDFVTFTSSSTVDGFFKTMISAGQEPLALLEGAKVVSIGEITSNTCRQYGIKNIIEAENATIDSMVETIIGR